MQNAKVVVPKPINEPVLEYRSNSPERISLINKINDLKSQNIEIPLIIDGNEIKTGNTEEIRIPHNHNHILGVYHKASEKEIKMATESAMDTWSSWSKMPWEDRVAIFKKMASIYILYLVFTILIFKKRSKLLIIYIPVSYTHLTLPTMIGV